MFPQHLPFHKRVAEHDETKEITQEENQSSTWDPLQKFKNLLPALYQEQLLLKQQNGKMFEKCRLS